MNLIDFCRWIQTTPPGIAMRESVWIFNVVETIHTLGIVLVAGTIMLVDLRLLGLGLRDESVPDVVRRIVPWTLSGFCLMLFTGSWLFAGEALKLYASPAFRVKLVLLLLAGVNALVFHLTVYRRVGEWVGVPARARMAGVLSLLLWIGVIAAGRSIAYMAGYDRA